MGRLKGRSIALSSKWRRAIAANHRDSSDRVPARSLTPHNDNEPGPIEYAELRVPAILLITAKAPARRSYRRAALLLPTIALATAAWQVPAAESGTSGARLEPLGCQARSG